MAATHQYAGIPATHFIKAKAEVHSYEDALNFLVFRSYAVLASNVGVRRTVPHTEGEYIGIYLYGHEILRYYPDGSWSADNCGYPTLTTTTRLNQFGPARVHFGHSDYKLHANGHLCSHLHRYMQVHEEGYCPRLVLCTSSVAVIEPQPDPAITLLGYEQVVLTSEGGIRVTGLLPHDPWSAANERDLQQRIDKLMEDRDGDTANSS